VIANCRRRLATYDAIAGEALARQLGSSQSRVAKLEAADPSVSLDLLIRALLTVGASRKDVAAAIVRRVA
jgi:predicted transcriptional regulator